MGEARRSPGGRAAARGRWRRLPGGARRRAPGAANRDGTRGRRCARGPSRPLPRRGGARGGGPPPKAPAPCCLHRGSGGGARRPVCVGARTGCARGRPAEGAAPDPVAGPPGVERQGGDQGSRGDAVQAGRPGSEAGVEEEGSRPGEDQGASGGPPRPSAFCRVRGRRAGQAIPAAARASDDQALAGWRMGPGPVVSQSHPGTGQAAGAPGRPVRAQATAPPVTARARPTGSHRRARPIRGAKGAGMSCSPSAPAGHLPHRRGGDGTRRPPLPPGRQWGPVSSERGHQRRDRLLALRTGPADHAGGRLLPVVPGAGL